MRTSSPEGTAEIARLNRLSTKIEILHTQSVRSPFPLARLEELLLLCGADN